MRLQADSDLAQLRERPAASVEAVEKERAILEGLERIDGLRREDAPTGVLLDAVRALLSDAEDWVRADPTVPASAAKAIERSRDALAAGETRAKTARATP
jgi:hypothetical protein